MAIFYADSSVLVKRHVQEHGSMWFRYLTAPRARNRIETSRLSLVEVISALSRRVREGTLPLTVYAAVRDDFLACCRRRYRIVPITGDVLHRAQHLLEQHPLRAYDALHLASALEVHLRLTSAGLPPLTFLAADDQLLGAATAEGLPVDNPHRYP